MVFVKRKGCFFMKVFILVSAFLLFYSNQVVAYEEKKHSWEEIHKRIEKVNAASSEEEQINNIPSYKKFHSKDPKLPPWGVIVGIYRKEHSNTQGLSAFLFPQEDLAGKFYF